VDALSVNVHERVASLHLAALLTPPGSGLGEQAARKRSLRQAIVVALAREHRSRAPSAK